MNIPVRKTIPQSIWLLVLASVLLWGQIVNAQHIHLDHHAPHECMSCQQLSASDALASTAYCPPLRPLSDKPLATELTTAKQEQAQNFAIRAPPRN
ncbi:hypothetical protein [uncultured Pseudoteredinibacter sp.]|uniref:hypothetical protein n=1 Tax=uncultured Pseudoteredinibacter sp. TaxID=1641701 RepID=UPI00262B2998|nr:hypothetical protein [uncultured Pseudoteredinibacter sp.]